MAHRSGQICRESQTITNTNLQHSHQEMPDQHSQICRVVRAAGATVDEREIAEWLHEPLRQIAVLGQHTARRGSGHLVTLRLDDSRGCDDRAGNHPAVCVSWKLGPVEL
jgi:hypothetical protein